MSAGATVIDCLWCDEPLGENGPRGEIDPVALRMHRECALRSVIGSVGHQRGECSCYGGDVEDPPGMTRREAARVAMLHWAEQLASKCFRGGDGVPS
jgi:hypothetical protein